MIRIPCRTCPHCGRCEVCDPLRAKGEAHRCPEYEWVSPRRAFEDEADEGTTQDEADDE